MEGNGLGKLIPKSIGERRRKKQSITGDSDLEELSRGRSVSRETTTTENQAAKSLGKGAGQESGNDSPSAARLATVSTNPSRIGYMTSTSSPVAQAENLQEPLPIDSQVLDRAATVPAPFDRGRGASLNSKSSLSSLAPPPPPSAARSPSPVGRFKDVFRKKPSNGTGSPSPERPERRSTTTDARSVDPLSRSNGGSSTSSVQSSQEPEAAKATPSERFRRLSKGQSIDTTRPPRTPPTAEKGTPVIVNTPPTPTDPRHSTSHPPAPSADSPVAAATTKSNASSPPSSMITRRSRAGSASAGPSKLSNITAAPLSPMPENGPTTPSAAGFFSSMISAAQTATNSLSNTINNTNIAPWNNNTKKGLGTAKSQEGLNEEDKTQEEDETPTQAPSEESVDSKELAVKTLGMGDLSLSQLGIVEPISSHASPSTSQFSDAIENRARSDSAPERSQPLASADESLEDLKSVTRAKTAYQPQTDSGDRTPPPGSVYEGKSGVQRSASIRSAIDKRRHRGSSAATVGTGGAIGAAISAAHASVARPYALHAPPAHKHTGFAVASKKRNTDFHALFKSVPDDDYLIEDYSCAVQREILAHGRLYVSEGHLCFSSNILGWVTTLVMSFDEIVSVEKRSTALVFKNGLMISTLHAKHVFASFTSRDSTYDLIVKIWNLGHPSLQSSLNGVRIDETGGDKTEKVDSDDSDVSGSASGTDDESDDEDDVYDEDEETDEAGDAAQATDIGTLEPEPEKGVTRKPSGIVGASSVLSEKPKEAPASGGGEGFPGPLTHASTDCGDASAHYEKILADDVIPAPLGKVFSMIFGAQSVTWMAKWLANDQKCTDLQMEDQKGLGPDNKSRTYTYIKPLSGAIGPKQTKCIVTESVDYIDPEKAIHINCSTQNPDVPSGNVFSVKTKYCFTWAENNATRIQVNCTVEWTGKSWLKGPIEKGVNDGQGQYCKELFAGLKAALSSRPRSGTVSNSAGVKGKKKRRKGKAAQVSSPTSDAESVVKTSAKHGWGVLEPVHGLVGPAVDIVRPLLTGNVMYGLLVGLLVATWFNFGFTNRQSPSRYGHDVGYPGYTDRLAAYEEMWRREESELWEWLEERIGLDQLRRKKAEEKVREEGLDDLEIREAIKLTEEKLNALKSALQKRGGQGGDPRA